MKTNDAPSASPSFWPNGTVCLLFASPILLFGACLLFRREWVVAAVHPFSFGLAGIATHTFRQSAIFFGYFLCLIGYLACFDWSIRRKSPRIALLSLFLLIGVAVLLQEEQRRLAIMVESLYD